MPESILKTNKFTSYLIWYLTGLVSLPFVFSSVLLWLGIESIPIITVSILLIVGLLPLFMGSFKKEMGYAFLSAVGLMGFSALLGWGALDLSYDGQGYHQEAIIQIMNGWNPYYELADPSPSDLWIHHYPKAAWITSAFYASFLGIEAAKMLGFLLCFLNLFLSIRFLNRFKNLSNWIVVLSSILMAFSPVCLNTLLSHTNDGIVCSSLLAIFLLLMSNDRSFHWSAILQIILLSVFAFNIKFNGTIYLGFLFIGFSFYYFVQSDRHALKSIFGIGIVSFVLGVLVWGWNPYVKNTMDKGHIFYPVLGELQQEELAQDYIPTNFSSKTNLEKLVLSSFAKTGFSQSFNQEAKYKIPFYFDRYEITRYAGTGVMLGGFGVWFSGLLLISFFMIIYFISQFSRYKWLLFFLGVIVLTTVINPLCWWFRFVPQFSFVPIICCLGFMIVEGSKLKKWTHLFLILIAVNSVLMMGYFGYHYYESNKLRKELDQIHYQQLNTGEIMVIKLNRHQSSVIEKLRTYQIPFDLVEELPCVPKQLHKLIELEYCLE